MSRKPTRIELLTLWTAVLGILSAGVCCLDVPGAAAGWVSACHSGGGTAQCSDGLAAGCAMSALAVANDASNPSGAEQGSSNPAAVAARILPGSGVSPDLAATGGTGSIPSRDGATVVYLLHSTFLL